jgi:hypothetical protein
MAEEVNLLSADAVKPDGLLFVFQSNIPTFMSGPR